MRRSLRQATRDWTRRETAASSASISRRNRTASARPASVSATAMCEFEVSILTKTSI